MQRHTLLGTGLRLRQGCQVQARWRADNPIAIPLAILFFIHFIAEPTKRRKQSC